MGLKYKQQLEVVQGLSIPSDTTLRMDCPFCNNINTLLVDTTENNLSWYCFHTSCTAKGKKNGEKDIRYVEKVFKSNMKDTQIHEEFKVPDSFQSIYSNEKAMRWLSNNNCWESWSWGRADFKYDVKQSRVVFIVKNRYLNKISAVPLIPIATNLILNFFIVTSIPYFLLYVKYFSFFCLSNGFFIRIF